MAMPESVMSALTMTVPGDAPGHGAEFRAGRCVAVEVLVEHELVAAPGSGKTVGCRHAGMLARGRGAALSAAASESCLMPQSKMSTVPAAGDAGVDW
jgi:hypothetical protein